MKKRYHRFMVVMGICLFTALVTPAWSDTTAPEHQDTAGQAVTQSEALSDPSSDENFFEDRFFDEDLDDPDTRQVADPLYYFNYGMYVVNDKLYYYVLKPVATGYKSVMPLPARKGIRNFFHNLMFPVRFVNNLLQ
ncbi:MAG: VacJ family lipoprotein, partial [Desulfobacteraceae bacterium]|nr:VacJ family lipoprotein [Desulfobacteraceae bacterium]